MKRFRWIGMILILPILLLRTSAPSQAAPLMAVALTEGRTYDQAHDSGYIDWSGPAQYINVYHRDFTFLPTEEGGASCSSGCWEWVTRLGNGGGASGSFDRDVSYFEVMVGFTPDSNVGTATLRSCSSASTWTLQTGSGQPGFVSMDLPVPAGCRSWSLTASGGYVDFRSIDVFYSGPPATATATLSPTSTFTPSATFTPTLTPTLTFTPTMKFTPTATYTNTPSPTPTPLLPQITGVVVCDQWGDAGWCRGNETLELSSSDPQGFDVTITGNLNGEPFTCGNSCDLPLPEGTGTANYTVTSTSGRTASGSSTWRRDATPPDLNVILPPVDGRNGWYVSQVTLLATATDLISGLSSLNGSLDEGVTWIPFPITFVDGTHRVMIRARDVAGNEVTVINAVRVDTVPPVAQITSHHNGEVVRGDVHFSGSLVDGMSGPEGGEVSIDGGNTWQSVSMDSGNDWSYIWDSSEVPNGEYAIQLRGMDRAGNVGDVVSITLTVDNAPPAVSISEHWLIWESGQLKISSNNFPIANVLVTIRDPQNRWPKVIMELNPSKSSFPIVWDRRFADGTIAPSGEYPVVVEACDMNGLCGHDTGRITIPVMAATTATLTPSPTVTSSLTPSATTTPTQQILPSATPVLITPIPKSSPKPSHSSLPLWQVIGVLGLFMVIASASVVDPRPKALERLGETFRALSSQANDDSVENQ